MKKILSVLLLAMIYFVMPITGAVLDRETGNGWWLLLALPYFLTILGVATYAMLHGPAGKVCSK